MLRELADNLPVSVYFMCMQSGGLQYGSHALMELAGIVSEGLESGCLQSACLQYVWVGATGRVSAPPTYLASGWVLTIWRPWGPTG